MNVGKREEWIKNHSKSEVKKFFDNEFKEMQKCEYCGRRYTKKNYPVMVFLNDKPINVCLKCVIYEWYEKATKYTKEFE